MKGKILNSRTKEKNRFNENVRRKDDMAKKYDRNRYIYKKGMQTQKKEGNWMKKK